MNKYFEQRNEYFEEPTACTEYKLFVDRQKQSYDFFKTLNDDKRYIVRRAKSRFLGYVEKQNR